MKISIITVTFNSAETIRDTIESVISQSYTDVEFIVKDGGSKDNTLEIVKGYSDVFGSRLKIISEPDEGIYDAMNRGISVASGDVVGILNSDDMLYDEHILADIAHTFTEYGVDCVYGDLVFVKETDTNSVVRTWTGSQYRRNSFSKGWAPAHPTFYVKRECYEKYGMYDVTMKVSADFDLMMRFLEKNKIRNKYMRRNFVKMRYGGESTGSLKNVYKGNKNIQKAFEKNDVEMPKLYYLRRLTPKLVNLIKNRITPRYLESEIDIV
jgi:glycosyltransferase involved in cell wall biosynthesis